MNVRSMARAQMTAETLPEPDARDRVLSAELSAHIRDRMRLAGGYLSFARYMDLALNAPRLGYYRAARARFGREGDFVTAPELSGLFAACLSRQVGEILEDLGNADIFEAGAGSGRLCAGLLTGLGAMNRLPRHYFILEPGAEMRQRQQETLEREAPEFLSRVMWSDDLPAAGFIGVVLANELLDSLPVRRFKITGRRPLEACVAPKGDGFQWRFEAPLDAHFEQAVAEIEAALGAPLPEGYTSELGDEREAWVGTVAERLERGAVLLMDYGYGRREYYHPQRLDGTLMCFYRHRAHADPFIYPGLQDISAHVEYSGLCRAARSSGLEIAGFTTQADFLMATGLLDACRDVEPGSRRFLELTGQIKRLTLPAEMGELIKVLALTRSVDVPLSGFSGRDYRGHL